MIRKATKQDIAILIDLMKQYANEAPINVLQNIQDPTYVGNLLLSLIAGRGFIFIDDKYKGFIAAIVTNNIWCPKVLELRELAWWVDSEHRNTSIGGKLWMKFNDQANEWLKSGRVQIVTVTSMSISPKFDYAKRGYNFLESTHYKCQPQ
jgi:hypothetical protein